VLGVNAWVIHSDENIWGKDVHEFRPERWLVGKEQVAYLDQHFLAVSVLVFIFYQIIVSTRNHADRLYSLVPVQEHA
jgi:hypothetical protein